MAQNRLKHPKQHYRDKAYLGYQWYGLWKGLHHFVKDDGKRFCEIMVKESDIDDESYKFMIEKGLSRIR